jgi:hypothetical protein
MTPADCFSSGKDGLGVGLAALGVANKVRRALSAAKIKASAFMGRSLALLLRASNEKPLKSLVFFADCRVLCWNTYNFLKEVGCGPQWLANPQTPKLRPLLNLGELLK